MRGIDGTGARRRAELARLREPPEQRSKLRSTGCEASTGRALVVEPSLLGFRDPHDTDPRQPAHLPAEILRAAGAGCGIRRIAWYRERPPLAGHGCRWSF